MNDQFIGIVSQFRPAKPLNKTLPKLSILQQDFKTSQIQGILCHNKITLPIQQLQKKKIRFTSHYLELQLCLKGRRRKISNPTEILNFDNNPQQKDLLVTKSLIRPIKLVSIKKQLQRQSFIKDMSTILETSQPLDKKNSAIYQKPRHQRFYNKSLELRQNFKLHQTSNSSGNLLNKNKAIITISTRLDSNYSLNGDLSPLKSHDEVESYSKKHSSRKQPYRVYFGKGNNSQLVRKIVLSRKNWIQTTQHDSIFSLRWQQSTQKMWYGRITFERFKQTVNHLKMHQEISSKAGLLQSLDKYCGRRGIDVFDIMPVSFVLDWEHPQRLEGQLKKFVFYHCENNPNNVSLKKERQYIGLAKILNNESQTKLSNFSFQKCKNNSIFPLSKIYLSENSKYVWMLKPNDLNRGRGIKIWCTLEQLTEILSREKCQKSSKVGCYVVQKYIERPMLIEGRKFDIRVWVLVDSLGVVYFFQEGYLRTSCEEYRLQNLQDIYIHLTNNAIQSKSQNYGKFQQGNQLSFSQFNRSSLGTISFKDQTLPQIKQITSLTIQSAMKKMFPTCNRNTCGFQIFGLDYMLDQTGKPWLIEVNTNPCLETSSQILQCLIPRMLDDAFKIVLDTVYSLGKSCNTYPVQGYSDGQNLWRLLPNCKRFNGKDIPK